MILEMEMAMGMGIIPSLTDSMIFSTVALIRSVVSSDESAKSTLTSFTRSRLFCTSMSLKSNSGRKYSGGDGDGDVRWLMEIVISAPLGSRSPSEARQ